MYRTQCLKIMRTSQVLDLVCQGHLASSRSINCRHVPSIYLGMPNGSVRNLRQIIAKPSVGIFVTPFPGRVPCGLPQQKRRAANLKDYQGKYCGRRTWICSASAFPNDPSRGRPKSRLQRFAWDMAKVAGGLALVLAAFVVALPSILSTKAGLRSALAVANRFVPGTIAVKQVCCPPAHALLEHFIHARQGTRGFSPCSHQRTEHT